MDDLRAQAERLDPLERVWRGRAVVLVAGLTVLLVLAVSATRGAPTSLPGIALGSSALLHVERVLLVGALIAGSFIFLIRGWAGYFPSKLSTTGAEYGRWPSSAVDLSYGDDETSSALADLRTGHAALVRATREALDDLSAEVENLGRQVSEAYALASNQDDRL